MREAPPELASRLARVRLAAFDVDGVLTDGRFLLAADGTDSMSFHTRDGLGIRLLLDAGVPVALVTGRDSAALAKRAEALGIPHVHRGVRDKAACLRAVADAEGVSLDEVLFLGDDLPDLPAMALAGVAAAVADAPPEVRARARLVTERPGGHGAVREAAEAILRARGLWEEAVRRFGGRGAEAAEAPGGRP